VFDKSDNAVTGVTEEEKRNSEEWARLLAEITVLTATLNSYTIKSLGKVPPKPPRFEPALLAPAFDALSAAVRAYPGFEREV
jgi:hypothetical protein